MKECPVPVLYEDNHVLVVDKPAGMLTQPTPEKQESLEVLCKEWIKEKQQKPGNVFLGVVHRLDKPVGGLVVFAKTSKALSRLNQSMREGKIEKVYVAHVEGHMPGAQGVLEHYLVHDEYRAQVVGKGVSGAKLARLRYRVLDKGVKGDIVEFILETGRYHQIRVQCAAVGAPIVGDGKYGSASSAEEIALRHVAVRFEHPVTKEIVSVRVS